MTEESRGIPDAWITDENVLYVVPKEHETTQENAARANVALAEWNSSVRLTARNFWPSQSEVLYVDPAQIGQQRWPASACTRTRVTGWVRVMRFDLGGIAPDARA